MPLGDSYTICEGAKSSECWTELLTVSLYKKGVKLEVIANPARSGFTTKDLIERELPLLDIYKPDFVTLLIGVNDWVQDVPIEEFKTNYIFILDKIQESLPEKQQILILSIPDFSVKPEGKKFGNGRNISDGIASFNEIIFSIASERGLKVVDLFKLSQEIKYDKQSVAEDGLHPSAKEYAIWEKMIFQPVFELLREKEK
ncbi:MAG: SGNH/GDSL hydrolase family protein [Bacteroidetes bacterium]|nr:SGNH/GDSL hydrolase family protein [Bacteroidota bacterium]